MTRDQRVVLVFGFLQHPVEHPVGHVIGVDDHAKPHHLLDQKFAHLGDSLGITLRRRRQVFRKVEIHAEDEPTQDVGNPIAIVSGKPDAVTLLNATAGT